MRDRVLAFLAGETGQDREAGSVNQNLPSRVACAPLDRKGGRGGGGPTCLFLGILPGPWSVFRPSPHSYKAVCLPHLG